MYIYPDNLSAKATLWLWELRDIGIIGVGLLLSVLALTQTGIALPLVLTAVFAFLTIRHEGTSILDFIRYAAAFLITKQQYYPRCKHRLSCQGRRRHLGCRLVRFRR